MEITCVIPSEVEVSKQKENEKDHIYIAIHSPSVILRQIVRECHDGSGLCFGEAFIAVCRNF